MTYNLLLRHVIALTFKNTRNYLPPHLIPLQLNFQVLIQSDIKPCRVHVLTDFDDPSKSLKREKMPCNYFFPQNIFHLNIKKYFNAIDESNIKYIYTYICVCMHMYIYIHIYTKFIIRYVNKAIPW